MSNYIVPTLQKPVPPTLTELLDQLKRDIMKSTNAIKVGVIQSFDPALQEVTVKIAQQQVTSIAADGTKTISEYPLLLRVPIQFPAGGGFTLTFPIARGDECLVLFNDRQIDNWLVNGPGLPPTIGRVHDIADGIAIVGIRSNPRALAGVSSSSAQLRSDDGSTYVEIAGGGIVNIIAPTAINITAPTVTITASTEVIIDTPLETITGTMNVENSDSVTTPFTVNGDINVTGDVIANGVSLDHHVHSGVTAGGSDTGPPA